METGFHRYALHERALDKLSGIGYDHPTPVQAMVIPRLLQKENLIVEAATGTGKTAAYGLPLLSRVDYLKRNTQALILVPSRELAIQVLAALRSYTSSDQVRIEALYGGSALKDAHAKIKTQPHILIAVPGRLRDALTGDLFPWFWRNIRYLVIDEADKLLESGFLPETDQLISNVRKSAQVALFSATISKDIESLIRDRFKKITTVRLSAKEALRNIHFFYTDAGKGGKAAHLAGLIEEHGIFNALIFCNKREDVFSILRFLRALGKTAEAYHGHLDQVEREAVMSRFKNKQLNFLVATDLAARGLDIVMLPAVINYAFPEELEVYLHRVGRTGRAGLKGQVYNLIGSKLEEVILAQHHEKIGIKIRKIETKALTKEASKEENPIKLTRVHINRGKKDKIRKGDVVGFLVNDGYIDSESIGTIAIYDTYTVVSIPSEIAAKLEKEEHLSLKGKAVKVRKFGLNEQKARAKGVKKRVISSKKRNLNKKR